MFLYTNTRITKCHYTWCLPKLNVTNRILILVFCELSGPQQNQSTINFAAFSMWRSQVSIHPSTDQYYYYC